MSSPILAGLQGTNPIYFCLYCSLALSNIVPEGFQAEQLIFIFFPPLRLLNDIADLCLLM